LKPPQTPPVPELQAASFEGKLPEICPSCTLISIVVVPGETVKVALEKSLQAPSWGLPLLHEILQFGLAQQIQLKELWQGKDTVYTPGEMQTICAQS